MLSVIVPIYNSEEYLDRCLTSLMNQTYKDVEYILIDNGSTDNSNEICKGYVCKCGKFKLLRKKHGGVASARNLGLDNVKGDYITFVDSDDDLNPLMYEKMMSLISLNNADIAICNANNATEINRQISLEVEILNHDQAFFNVLENKISSHLWNKVFKKFLLEDIRISETDIAGDLSVMHLIFDKANKTVITKEKLYNYFINQNSVTHNPENNIRNKLDRANSFEARYLYALEKYKYQSERLFNLFIHFYLSSAVFIIINDDFKSELESIRLKLLSYKKNNFKKRLSLTDLILFQLVVNKKDKLIRCIFRFLKKRG